MKVNETGGNRVEPVDFKRLLDHALFTPFLLVAVITALLVAQFLRFRALVNWVDHTDRVISQTHFIQRLVIDRETGVRGFLLTGEKRFLDPYYKAGRALEAAWDL